MHLCVDSVRDGRSRTSRRVRLCRELRHEEVSFYLYLLLAATRPTATRLAVTRLSATRHTAKRSAAIRPAAKRSCLSHSRQTSLILHDTLHSPRTSSFQLPWEGRGVSDVMLNSFGFISLGTSPFASHRSSGFSVLRLSILAVTRPAATRPAATRPAATRPAATRPASTRPAATRPAATRPAATRPARTNPCLSHSRQSSWLMDVSILIQPTFNQHNLRPRYPRHGQSIQRSSDPAIQRSSNQKTDTPLCPQAHRRSRATQGPE